MKTPAWFQGPRRHVVLFTLVVATGFLNLVSRSWGPFFRVNLILHPLLALLVTASLLRSVFARLRTRVPGLSPVTGLAFVAIFFLALLRVFALKHLPIEVSNRIAGQILPPLFVLCVFLVLRAIPLLPRVEGRGEVLLHVATLVVWTLTATLGAWILVARGRPTARMVFDFHTVLGVAATIVGWLALVRPGSRGTERRWWLRPVAAGAGLFAAVGLVVEGGARLLSGRGWPTSIEVHLSSVPYQQRAEAERDPVPFAVDASWLDISRSCGAGDGCHAALVEESRHSLHGVSYRPSHVSKVLDLLVEETGVANQGTCAGCHLPRGLLVGGEPRAAADEDQAISCVACHSVVDAAVDDPLRSRYRLRLDPALLAPFREAEMRGSAISRRERFLLGLNPRAHGRAFRRPVLAEDRFCLACHHGTLGPIAPGPTCVACHMEPASELGREGAHRNHLFPGSNVATYTLLGWPEIAKLNERWAQSEMLVRTLEDLYVKGGRPERKLDDQRLPDFFYLRVGTSLARGGSGRASLRVRTANTGITHAFPASSLDIAETWLEVRVTDRAGRAVFSSGGTDETGRILEGTRTLGGAVLGPDGTPIEHYRIWLPTRTVIERQVRPGEAVDDTFDLEVPEGVLDLNVEVTWRYRKLGWAFWRWAYGDQVGEREVGSPGASVSPPSTPPTLDVVRHFTQYRVEAP